MKVSQTLIHILFKQIPLLNLKDFQNNPQFRPSLTCRLFRKSFQKHVINLVHTYYDILLRGKLRISITKMIPQELTINVYITYFKLCNKSHFVESLSKNLLHQLWYSQLSLIIPRCWWRRNDRVDWLNLEKEIYYT